MEFLLLGDGKVTLDILFKRQFGLHHQKRTEKALHKRFCKTFPAKRFLFDKFYKRDDMGDILLTRSFKIFAYRILSIALPVSSLLTEDRDELGYCMKT